MGDQDETEEMLAAAEQAAQAYDLIWLLDGRLIKVHGPKLCEGSPCCIHHPSDHKLKDATLYWHQPDRQMMRVCEHGKPHPDPDDLSHKELTLSKLYLFGQVAIADAQLQRWLTHFCDGCCDQDILPGEGEITEADLEA